MFLLQDSLKVIVSTRKRSVKILSFPLFLIGCIYYMHLTTGDDVEINQNITHLISLYHIIIRVVLLNTENTVFIVFLVVIELSFKTTISARQ